MNALDPTLAMATRGRDPSLVSMGVVLCGEVDPAAISAAAGEDAGGIQFYAVAIAEELKPRIQEMADRLGGRLRVIHFPVNHIIAVWRCQSFWSAISSCTYARCYRRNRSV